MILQRYTFGSKSQPNDSKYNTYNVAYDIAKIYIWKQITTCSWCVLNFSRLLMILQRYTFGSKSQRSFDHKKYGEVAYDIAKIYIWKQITTKHGVILFLGVLLMILQRYTFGSKSQPKGRVQGDYLVAYDIAKIYIWKQITTACR